MTEVKTNATGGTRIAWKQEAIKILLFLAILLPGLLIALQVGYFSNLQTNIATGYALCLRCDQAIGTLGGKQPTAEQIARYKASEQITVPSRLWFLPALALAGGGVAILIAELYLICVRKRSCGGFFWLLAPVLLASAVGAADHIAQKRELRQTTALLAQQFDDAIQHAQQAGVSRADLREVLQEARKEFQFGYERASSGFNSMRQVIASVDRIARRN